MKRVWIAAGLLAGMLRADQDFPGPNWREPPDPVASSRAVAGGEISAYGGQYPKSLNYYLDNNTFNDLLFECFYNTLLTLDGLTAEWTPGVARQWTLSDDKKTFTFRLDERARWSDGRPITADDVRWTFDAVMNPTNLTGAHKVSLEKFDPPEVLDKLTVRFRAREVHWRNLGAAGSFHILPRHAFEKEDFNKINFALPVVSGLYRLDEVKEGQFLKLRRRPDAWARADRRYQHVGNFEAITFRCFEDNENAFEAFKKGMIDIYPVYTSRLWVNETGGEKFQNHWIVKQTVHNYEPRGFQGFAMNLRRPPFDEVEVRKAMAYLLDRDRMNRTLMYNQYFLHRSYFEDLYTSGNPCRNPAFEFNPDKARVLLREAGWQVNPQTGFLEKEGRRFTFKFLTRDPSTDKFLAIYGEALKDAGIEFQIDRKDWAAWAKDMDEFHFDMTWAAWGAGLFKDPESMWASKEADRKGGNNITGFRDPEVDRLVEKQRTLFDLQTRNAICRQIDAIVTAQCPYVLLWNIDYVRLLYWNKFGTPPTVLSKFGDERAAYLYWWFDEDSASDLKNAMANGERLPARKPKVVFDEEFKKRN